MWCVWSVVILHVTRRTTSFFVPSCHLLSSPFFFSLPPINSRITQTRGIAGSSSPVPTTVRALHFYLEKISALSSLVNSRRIVLTHAISRRSQQLIPFLIRRSKKLFYKKNWKTSAVSTTDWMVETQLCKLRGTSRHVRWACLFHISFYKRLKNVSCEYNRLNGWNSTLQAAWYIRRVRIIPGTSMVFVN